MTQNLNQTPSKIILDLINDSNSGTPLEEGAVTFGTPSSVTPGDFNGRGTRLPVTVDLGSNNSVSKTVYYNRLDLALLFQGITMVNGDLNTSNLDNVAGYLTSMLDGKATLTAGDLKEAILDEASSSITVHANPGSLVYTGTVYILTQEQV